MKKDTSQIGINAREAVKFLDRVTSATDGISDEAITLQGSHEQYKTWREVEEHLIRETADPEDGADEGNEAAAEDAATAPGECEVPQEAGPAKAPESTGSALSQMLLNKLNFAKEPDSVSISSTPPASPTSSGPQSSKTSPEVKSAKLAEHDASIVPPLLKPLLNSVIWYTHQKINGSKDSDLIFLTNAAETASLARSFGVITKNIHQLRTLIGLEEQEVKNHTKYEKKHPSPSSTVVADTGEEPKSLFKYEDAEEEKEDSEDEVLVFKPRGRGMRGGASMRGSPSAPARSVNGHRRSPIPTFSTPSSSTQKKPEVPVEAIDPDSFDRGSFGRGSVPLANTAPHVPAHFQGFRRGTTNRGNFAPSSSNRGGFSPAGPSRGGFYRGAPRGFDRGSIRGRGRLFVP